MASLLSLPQELLDKILEGVAEGDDTIVITTKRLLKTRDSNIKEKQDFSFTSSFCLAFCTRSLYNNYRTILRKQLLTSGIPAEYQVTANIQNFNFNNVRKLLAAVGDGVEVQFEFVHIVDESFSAGANGLDKWVKYADGLDTALVSEHVMRWVEKTPAWWTFVQMRERIGQDVEGEWASVKDGMWVMWSEEKKANKNRVQEPYQRDDEDAVAGAEEDED